MTTVMIARAVPLCLAVILASHSVSLGVSGTDHIAKPEDVVRGPSTTSVRSTHDGKEVTTEATPWPAGVLALVNDPLRTDAWHFWFSELPNDVDTFDFEFRFARDVEHLVRAFAAIKSDALVLELDPATFPTGPRFADKPVGAVFRIGNQAIYEHWFTRLPADARGVRTFGVHRYTEPPRACPPTLTLRLRHHVGVDLSKLDVPLNVTVRAAIPDDYRASHKDDPAVKAVDAFVAAHARRQTEAAASGPRRPVLPDLTRGATAGRAP